MVYSIGGAVAPAESMGGWGVRTSALRNLCHAKGKWREPKSETTQAVETSRDKAQREREREREEKEREK